MLIADLHIHSKYSRATSRDCDPESLDLWARRKGINLVGTGDFTHPAWREELREKLIPAEEGLYTLRPDARRAAGGASDSLLTRFVVTGEISSIYKKDGKTRKIHSLILLPGLEEAERLSRRLEAIGNLHSDGRPILGLDCRDLLEITLESCPDAVFIPAHIWTPHFSLFGAFSGFDAIEACFGDLTPHIHAVETGLSSDPPMNWRLSALDGYTLVSNSDAHSPAKLGREANLLEIAPSYPALAAALQRGEGFYGTIEFFPEEGKYHFDGHRNCGQCLSPAQAEALSGICPVCGKRLTTGVLHRVEQLADRPQGAVRPGAKPFECLAPLPEVVAASVGEAVAGKKVQARCEALIRALGPEFFILRQAPLEDVGRVAGPCVAEGLKRLRAGDVARSPGYDGAFGAIELLSPSEREALNGQVSLFGAEGRVPKRRAAVKAAPGEKKREAADLPAALNPAQYAAATSTARAVAVAAGPGTGKTRTLVDRIDWLLEQGARPGEITAVTFTNRAAGELRARLDRALGRKARAVTVGTFHGLCLQALRDAGREIRLIGAFEARELASAVLQKRDLHAAPQKLLQAVSREKIGLPPEEGAPTEAVAPYCDRLKALGLMDFDDLLLETLALWAGDHPPKTRRFTHLLIDEFQDSSPLQYRLALAWNGRGRSLFAIGDPDQSIYGFRGADASCFDRLEGDFPGLERHLLTDNYRSTPEILSCALPFISQNPGPARSLTPHRPSGPQVRVLRAERELSEAIFVAKEINRMVGGVDMLDAERFGGDRETPQRSFSDVAVCYRTRRQAALLEQCLSREGIPCVVAGRDDCLTDRTVRGALSFFRLLLDPEDLLSLEAGLRLLWDVSGEAVQAVLGAWRGASGTAGERCAGLDLPPKLRPWLELAAAFAPRVAKEPPDRLLADWAGQARCGGSEALERVRNMAVFHTTMAEFLENLTLGREGDLLRRAGASYAAGAVTLSTFHAAKGLEFPAVFLCGLKNGLAPLESERGFDLEEERRLFYVAMTRAKEELLLLYTGEPSPFLAELPAGRFVTGDAAPPKKREAMEQLSFFS